MSLALVTPDTRRPSRFHASGGDLYVDGRRIALGEGYALSRGWFAEALTLHRKGQLEHAAHYRREALALEDAARECCRWRVAAGATDPLAWDREGARA